MSPSDRAEPTVHRPSLPVNVPGWRRRRPAWAVRPLRRAKAVLRLESTAASRARLSLVLLVYSVAMVAMVQLAPFGFVLGFDVRWVANSGWSDALTSLLLFIPLGFIYPLTRLRRNTPPLQVALWGGVIGMFIALGRTFELERDTALFDILASAVGAGIGGRLLHVVNERTRSSARLANRLSLEIPLIGLIYLLLPLVIATSVSAGDDVRRLLMLLPLGFLAARLLSGVQEHHFGPARVFTARTMSFIAIGWMTLGVFPAILQHPVLATGIVLLVGAATAYDTSLPAVHGSDRRFEADILKSAMPYVVVYFLDVVFLPLASGVDRWHFHLGLTGGQGDLARQIVHLLEPVTSLVLLGYLLAEIRGRREMPFRQVALRIALECAAVAAGIELSRAFQRQVGGSALEFMLLTGAGVLGASMYHHQRERVRWMLINRVTAAAKTEPMRAWARAL